MFTTVRRDAAATKKGENMAKHDAHVGGTRTLLLGMILATLALGLVYGAVAQEMEVPEFSIRSGYCVTVALPDLPGARFLESGPGGFVYVSLPREGRIVSTRDTNGDGVLEIIGDFVTGMPTVHGMCRHGDWLWFTQTGAIHRGRDTDGDGTADEVVTVLEDGLLPSGGGHWWRSILVTDEYLYTSIGDAGNITDQMETERQKIWRFRHDGSEKTLFASGLRNTEKLRLRPGTDEVWGCDHGSDWYGRPIGDAQGMQPVTDHNPPDELNHYVAGGFYGHPFIVGKILPRIEYYERPDIIELASKTTPPAWGFGAHWAVNGFTFLDGESVPASHRGDIFAALHGSWNSVKRVGYGIERILFDDETGLPYGALRIVTTLGGDGREVLARPVDCLVDVDGTVLFSCDHTGRIYRIHMAAE